MQELPILQRNSETLRVPSHCGQSTGEQSSRTENSQQNMKHLMNIPSLSANVSIPSAQAFPHFNKARLKLIEEPRGEDTAKMPDCRDVHGFIQSGQKSGS
jgi:hypothetical protein